MHGRHSWAKETEMEMPGLQGCRQGCGNLESSLTYSHTHTLMAVFAVCAMRFNEFFVLP